MKKLLVFAVTAATMMACNNGENAGTSTFNTDSSSSTNSNSTMVTQESSSTTSNAYVPAEGDISYRSGKVMVYRNNSYVETNEDVTLDGGIIVRKNGDVVNNDRTVRLEDGQSVSRTGKFFNKMGEGIEDGWDATKKGASKAAGAVNKAANKVGEEVKDAVN